MLQGSWGMMVSACRNSLNPSLETSTPSILMYLLVSYFIARIVFSSYLMVPSYGSINRNRTPVKLDFPAPVLPTIPTFSRGFNLQLTPYLFFLV